MKQKQLSLQSRMNSFGFAFAGLLRFFKTEVNAWIHLAATITLLGVMAWLKPSIVETSILFVVTGLVWICEAFNTVIEEMMDFISIERNPRIRYIKDLSAGAVLIAAITAAVTACIIFIPKII